MTTNDPTDKERVARNGSMMLRGTAVVSDSNGPFRLVMRVAGIENNIKLDTSQWTVSWASDPTPGDHDELLAEVSRFDADFMYGGELIERLAAALRTEQSARQSLQQRIDAALRSHTEREWRPLDGTYLGGTVCAHCRTSWPCAIVTALTAPAESEESERDDSVGRTLPPEWSSDE
jgi:hypothetical protein